MCFLHNYVFLVKKRIKCKPINKFETSSPVNIWSPSRDQKLDYKRRQQARGFSLSHEILLEARLPLLVCTGCKNFNEKFIFYLDFLLII